MTIQEKLKALGCEVTPCGSRITCNPPPINTDEDFLVLASSSDMTSEVVALLAGEQFEWEGDGEHYQLTVGSGFMSWRKDKMNIIFTANEDFARRHKAATNICKKLNVMEKADRVKIFQAFLYGNVV